MTVSFAGFSSKALCWSSVVAEKPSHATNPTNSAVHTESSPNAFDAIPTPTASPTAVTLFATRSWAMFLRLAFLESAGAMPVSRHHTARNTLPYQTPATAMPTTMASTVAGQFISIG